MVGMIQRRTDDAVVLHECGLIVAWVSLSHSSDQVRTVARDRGASVSGWRCASRSFLRTARSVLAVTLRRRLVPRVVHPAS